MARDSEMEKFGNNIREARKAVGMSFSSFIIKDALKADRMDPCRLALIEDGEQPSALEIISIAEDLGLPFGRFFENISQSHPVLVVLYRNCLDLKKIRQAILNKNPEEELREKAEEFNEICRGYRAEGKIEEALSGNIDFLKHIDCKNILTNAINGSSIGNIEALLKVANFKEVLNENLEEFLFLLVTLLLEAPGCEARLKDFALVMSQDGVKEGMRSLILKYSSLSSLGNKIKENLEYPYVRAMAIILQERYQPCDDYLVTPVVNYMIKDILGR